MRSPCLKQGEDERKRRMPLPHHIGPSGTSFAQNDGSDCMPGNW
jgi:hypothetical protein